MIHLLEVCVKQTMRSIHYNNFNNNNNYDMTILEIIRWLLLIGQKELDVGIFIRDFGFHFIHGRPRNGRPTDGSHSTIINIRRSEGICLHARLLLFVFIQQGNKLREALPIIPLLLTPFPRFHHLVGRYAVLPLSPVRIGRVSNTQQNVQVRLQDLRELPVHVLLLSFFPCFLPASRGTAPAPSSSPPSAAAPSPLAASARAGSGRS